MCSKALALIRITVVDARRTKMSSKVLAELDASVLMLILNTENDEIQGKCELTLETETKLAELMQLFQEMVKTSTLRTKVMQSFSEQIIRKLLNPMLDSETCAGDNWPGNFIQVLYFYFLKHDYHFLINIFDNITFYYFRILLQICVFMH